MDTARRELLFGVMVWRLNFLDEARVAEGLRGCANENSSLGAYLVRHGQISAAALRMLEPLVEDHLQRHGDDPLLSLAALEQAGPVPRALCAVVRQNTDHVELSDIEQTLKVPRVETSQIPERSVLSGDATVSPATAIGSVDMQATLVLSRGSTAEPAAAGEYPPAGRFHIVRPHAEGGLGRVFIARDVELGRQVALKEIKARFADDSDSRRRFVLEAEITGGLEHPGVVPVYGLGSYDDGRPYYAMQFIQGESLQDAIQQFHATEGMSQTLSSRNLQLRELLGRFIDVCQAIAYAHSRGVLHRDLKPGNIMLGKYGETLVVDWGLAKACGREVPGGNVEDPLSARGGSGIGLGGSGTTPDVTQVGAAMGTPQYMSPEQAAGRISELGPATDVYSLGATLYELLTGKTPFVTWSKTTGIRERLDDIQHGRFAPPRKVASGVPLALEAICLKAMASNTGQRYPSPLDLAADVKHWLADEPVSICREPFTARLARWSRKHPALIAGTVTGAMAVVLISSLSGVGFYLQNQVVIAARDAANNQRTIANEQRLIADEQRKIAVLKATEAQALRVIAEKNTVVAKQQEALAKQSAIVANQQTAKAVQAAIVAERQSALLLETLNSLVFDLSRSLENVAGGGELRRQVLSTALEKLDKVATQYVAAAVRDRTTAAALADMGDVVLRFGRGPRPDEELPTARPRDEENHSALRLARRMYEAAFEIRLQLAAAALDDPQARRDLAVSHLRLGDIASHEGKFDEALRAYEQARDLFQRQVTADATDAQARRDLAAAHNELGNLFLEFNQPESARLAFEKGLELFKALAVDATDLQAQRDLAVAWHKQGTLQLRLGYLEPAREAYQQSHLLLQKLADRPLADVEARRDLAVSWGRRGEIERQRGSVKMAGESLEQSFKHFKDLAAAAPTDLRAQRDLATAENKLGNILLQTGAVEPARQLFQQSLERFKNLAAASPSDLEAQRDLAALHNKLGNLELQLEDLDAARDQYQRGLEITQRLAGAAPEDERSQRELAISYNKLAEVQLERQALPAALELYQKSIDLFQTLAVAAPNDVQTQRDLAASFLSIGDVHLDSQNLSAARDAFAKGLAVFKAQASAAPADIQAQRDLAVAYLKLGYIEQRAAALPAAIAAYESSLATFDKIAAGAPEDTEAQRDLAIAHQSLGDARQQAGVADEAWASFGAALQITSRLAVAAPNDARAQSDWMTSLSRLATADRMAYRFQAAKASFASAREVLQRFVTANGRNPFDADLKSLDENLRYVETAENVVARLEDALKQPPSEISSWLELRINVKLAEAKRQPDRLLKSLEEVAKTAAALGGLVPPNASKWHAAMRGYALSVQQLDDAKAREAAAGTPASGHSPEAQLARAKYLKSALEALHETLRTGWTDLAALQNDQDFRSLSSLPEFKMLVMPP